MGDGRMGDETATGAVVVLGDTREAAALRRSLPTPSLFRADAPRALAADPIVIDARHPFDVATPASAIAAAARAGGYLRLLRPAWRPTPEDDWRVVADAAAARRALDPSWRRVFLTIGRDGLDAFAGDDERLYIVRVRGGDGAEVLGLVRYEVTTAEGPYGVEDEAAFLASRRIDAVVTRNVGGEGAFPKVAAARRLGLPVVMASRPATSDAPDAAAVETVEAALDWARASLGARR